MTVRPVLFGDNLDRFLGVPEHIYRDDPAWIPPLRRQVRDQLNPRKNPFLRYGAAQLFLAERGGEPVGRISAQINPHHDAYHGERGGFFGFFECVDDAAVARALLTAAEEWLRPHGADWVRGPFSFTINDELGVLVDGFDTPPTIAMAHSRPYYGALLERCGYARVKDVYAWSWTLGPLPDRFEQARAAIHALPGVTVRPIDKRHFQRDIRTAVEIFNDAWADNWGFVPITEEEADRLAHDLKQFSNPATTAIIEVDGEPAAMIVAITDLNHVIRDLHGRLFPFGVLKVLWRLRHPTRGRTILMGVKHRFRTRNLAALSAMLPTEMNALGLAHGFTWAELGWVLEDNRMMNNPLQRLGAHRYKTYRIYQKSL